MLNYAFISNGRLALAAVGALTLTSPATLASSAFQGTVPNADYDSLDDTPRDATNFNAPITHSMEAIPLSVAPFSALLAVNPHNHEVVAYTSGTEPVLRFKTPMNPVALNFLRRDLEDEFDDQLLVICRGTHVMVLMDPLNDGEILEVLQLKSEPADLVVTKDETRAFVSCANADVVQEVDIELGSATFMTVLHEYPIPSKRPTWLSIDYPDPVEAPDEFNVYVAPMLSGNNTTVVGNALFNDVMADLSGEISGGLKDSDLFRLIPNGGGVEPVLRSAGALMFGHGRHPNGDYWLLTTQSFNHTPTTPSGLPGQNAESELTGRFARTDLVIANIAPGTVTTPTTSIDLDPHTIDPISGEHIYAGQSEDEMIAGPWAMTFAPDGLAFVTGMMSDRVAVLNPNGTRNRTLIMPDGAIPRAVEIHPLYDLGLKAVYVQAWGTNTIEVFLLSQTPPADTLPYLTLQIGLDPAPPEVKAGREIFYDAAHSANNRLTCGTCHPDGGADGLAWNLSGLPFDNKGPLTTQILWNLEGIGPYHWRGERDQLEDFNDAFVGLLGADCQLTPQQFSNFESFVFGMTTQANPEQTYDRKLYGKAVQGQIDFQVEPTNLTGNSGLLTCVECHSLPIGTNADMVPEVVTIFPVRSHLDVTHLNNGNLTLRKQTIESVLINNNSVDLTALGAGLLHNGSQLSVLAFVTGSFGLDPLVAENIADFVNHFDYGMSPMAHRSWLMTGANAEAIKREIAGAMTQAAKAVPGVGLVVATADNVGSRWYLEQGVFVPDSRLVSPVALAFFVDQAKNHGGRFLFFAVPPGNGRIIGVDFDGDGLRNADEALAGADPLNPDSDGDGWLDGYEFDNPGSHPPSQIASNPAMLPTDSTVPSIVKLEAMWANARTMKAYFTTSEPCSFDVTISEPSGTAPIPNVIKTSHGIHHTIVVQDMIPSPQGGPNHNYAASITVTDFGGLSSPFGATNSMFGFDPHLGCIDLTPKIGFTEWDENATVSNCGAGTLQVKANFRIDVTGMDPTPLPQGDFGIFAYLMKRTPNPTLCNGVLIDNTPWVVHNDFTDLHSPAHPSTFQVEIAPGFPFPYRLENGITWFPGVSIGPAPDKLLLSTRSGSNGMVEFHFEAQNLVCGEEISIQVLGVMPVLPGWPNADAQNPDADVVQPNALFFYSMPETDVELRGLTRIF